ncbi:c-type cytochrome biogenesis protein CcmI [Chthonobacter rhizosphaerae]|uniref:c-type cytochrome biogenesis protein CcmI n=1 Tax=Chthonobacter rhizosphaerae TaxID=2735553 RepID=UPI0015EF772F|nr:c-type cytochrome biogenesis protein CcmI [Chthonobacter rhizosphaerae]
MLVWIVFALMTVAAALAVIVPLARHRRAALPASAHDRAVYRDQLAELERDRERGLIGAAEAEAARAEIARRLLKASEAAEAASPRRSWAKPAAMAATMAIPLLALGVYASTGSPDLPDQPLAARLQAPPDPNNVVEMIARVEAHLVNQPNDAEGWKVLAPIYLRTGRVDDAARAYREIIRIEGPSPELNEALGETLVAAGEGLVSEEAQAALDAAVQADPDRIKARYYRALGLLQAGRNEESLAEYDEIIRRSAADAPWLEPVRENRKRALAALGRPADTPEPAGLPAVSAGPAAGPGAADVAAAEAMSDEERAQMVAGMVQRLADRLEQNPRDPVGWMQLIRAYGVMERPEDASAALKKAEETFKDDPTILAQIQDAAKSMGLVP